MNEVLADRFYTSKPIEILMVEDNPGDVGLTREALKQNGVRSCNATLSLFGVFMVSHDPACAIARSDLVVY